MGISKTNQFKFIFATIILLTCGACVIAYNMTDGAYKIALTFSVIMFFLVTCHILEFFEGNLITPILLFSLLYLTASFSVWYLCITEFQTNNFTFGTTYNDDFETLFNKSVFYFLIGYIFLSIGYRIIPLVKKPILLELEDRGLITDWAVNVFIVASYIIGTGNFVYNVISYANGNIVLFFKNLSGLQTAFSESGGTTFGYNFAVYGALFVLFKYIRDGRKIDLKCLVLLLTAILIKASTGRVFSTMTILIIMIGVYYISRFGTDKNINKKLTLSIAGVLFFGIFLYMFRRVSSLSRISAQVSWWDSLMDGYSDILYYAFDRGNTVNMAIVPKIIDSWNNDIGFLCGKSFITSIVEYPLNALGIETENYYWTIKYEWFSDVTGGGLPPTIIGEMYMNFGVLGVIFGMFAFGCVMKLVYNWFLSRQSYFRLITYLFITIGFFLLVPKTASGNLPVFEVLFLICSYICLIVLSRINLYYSGFKSDKQK